MKKLYLVDAGDVREGDVILMSDMDAGSTIWATVISAFTDRGAGTRITGQPITPRYPYNAERPDPDSVEPVEVRVGMDQPVVVAREGSLEG